MDEKVCVESSQFDPNFKFEIAAIHGGERIFYCYQCGTCSATCPLQDRFDILPHQVIQKSLIGFRDEILNCKAIWVCTVCVDCTERCPQRVGISEVFFAIKNIAWREKKIPDVIKESITDEAKNLFDTGLVVPPSSAINKRREQLGLPESLGAPAEEIHALTKETGLEDLIRKIKEKEK